MYKNPQKIYFIKELRLNNKYGIIRQENKMKRRIKMDAEIKEMFGLILSKLDGMQNNMDGMQNQMNSMQDKIDKNTTEINHLRCLIEEEIRPQMRIIADGHLALVEKYNEIEKVKQSRELMEIRLLTLEAEIKQLKQAI